MHPIKNGGITTELGGWDEALLLQELQALLAEDFDLGLIGIPDDEVDALLADADERPAISDDAADAIPDPPADPITRPGDIWALGKHRLCCGDATDPATVAKLMQGVFAIAPVAADAQILVNLGLVHRDSEWQPYWEGWVEWMRKSGWRRFGWHVWDQGPGLPGDWNGRLAPSHEFIFHFNHAPRKPHKTVPSKHAGETLDGGGLRGADGTVHPKTGTGNAIQSHRIPDIVFRIMRHKGGLGAAGSHPAVFPVALVEAVLTAFTDPGDLIYEPFCGSGTQIVAAERAGRRCFAMELDPVYCDVAVRRWEMATGKAASLERY
jgi:DNA methylase